LSTSPLRRREQQLERSLTLAQQFTVQAGVAVGAEHHARIIRKFARGEIGEEVCRGSPAGVKLVERGKRLPVKPRVSQHRPLCGETAHHFHLAPKFSVSVFTVTTVIGVVFSKLPRGLRERARISNTRYPAAHAAHPARARAQSFLRGPRPLR
jgi:hypothetical protein